jgi:hypothetical protein
MALTREEEEELEETLKNFDEALSSVETHLATFFSLTPTYFDKLSSLQRAKMSVAVAYAINSLFYSNYSPTIYKLNFNQCI